MSNSATAAVLAKIAAYDPTFPKPDPIILAAWAEALAGCGAQDALDAVAEHYRATRDRIMPADILRIVRSHPKPVTAANYNMVPDADPDDVKAWLEALRRGELVDRSPKPDTPRRPVESLVTAALARRPEQDRAGA